MSGTDDVRGAGKARTLGLLLAIAAVFFAAIIVRRLLWP